MTELSKDDKFIISLALADMYIDVMRNKVCPDQWVLDLSERLGTTYEGTLKRIYELQERVAPPLEVL